MKKNLIELLLIFLAMNTGSDAQEKNTVKNLDNDKYSTSEFMYNDNGRIRLIRADIARDFLKRFDTIKSVAWFEAVDGYVANFRNDEIKTFVNYDKKGNWIYTSRIYGEKNLKKDIRHIVKSTYYDHSIRLVHEINFPNDKLVYFIHLESRYELIDLELFEDEIKELRRYMKQ